MADDFDVEAMLEAPYRSSVQEETGGSGAAVEEKEEVKKREKNGRASRSRSRERERKSRRSRSRSKDRRRRSRSRDRDNKRSRSRNRDRDRDVRKRSPERERRRRSRSKDRKSGRSGSKDRSARRRSRSRDRSRRSRSRDNKRRSGSRSPRNKDPDDIEPTPESRDSRTVFVMQLSQRVRARDLENFFSSVGKVRDVKIISDRNSRRSKGVGYVEFQSDTSVPLAMGLNNQKLMGVPIIVQPSQAEKNRAAQTNQTLQKGSTGPMRLYVGSLHYNITEEMLRGIFEPFGKIDNIQLMMDSETGRSKGYGFITFHDAEDAKRALDQLNGFELAGRPMKVNHVTERNENAQAASLMDNDELERTGIELSATDRISLMVKLAEGKDFRIPTGAMEVINPLSHMPGGGAMPQASIQSLSQSLAAAAGLAGNPVNLQASLAAAQAQAQHQAAALAAQQVTTAIAGGAGVAAAPITNTPSFMLSNMFDPTTETNPNWDFEIREDVIEECNKHGGVLHIHVDKASPQGNVYVKCPTPPVALAAVNSLHGRWFAGKMITAAYVPLANYHAIFPDAMNANTLLQSATGR